ncbi:Murein DD-endopeptidase MepM [compost metagenome]
MKAKLQLKHYTVMLIRDPRQSVLRLRVPVLAMLATPLLFAGACAWAYYSTYHAVSAKRTSQELQTALNEQARVYESNVSGRDMTIDHLQEELLRLSEQAGELDERMNEIRKLEEEMQRLVGLGSGSAELAAIRKENADAGGIGGTSRAITDQDTDELIAKTADHYNTILGSMETLYSQLNDTKLRVVEQQARLAHTPSIWPVESRTITSPFGMRRDPFTFSMVYHSGLDIGAKSGAAVHATADGTVSSTGFDSYHGNNIIIDHGSGLKTWYMHLSKIGVEKGEEITKGQEIGLVGSTGRSTGPHLHYEVLKDNKSVDPNTYLKGARKEE